MIIIVVVVIIIIIVKHKYTSTIQAKRVLDKKPVDCNVDTF